MQMVDWITIGIILLTAVIGLLLGFGKILKIFTGGFIGVLISVVVTYFFIGVVASWGFVQDIMARFVEAMEASESGFVHFLLKIGIERIVLGIALFIVIQIIRIIIVNIIKSIVEIENPVIKAINKIGGMILMLAIMCMIALLVFHVVDLIGGSTEESFRDYLTGAMRLDWVFDNNPLKYIITRATSTDSAIFFKII